MVSSRDTNFAPYESAVGLKGVLAKPGATTGECSNELLILDDDFIENITKICTNLKAVADFHTKVCPALREDVTD